MKFNKMTCSLILLLVICCLYSTSVAAASNNKPFDISITFNYDTKTEMNFTWLTNDKTEYSIVEIWEETGQVLTYMGNRRTVSSKHAYSSDENKYNDPKNTAVLNINNVSVKGLKPNTKYYYKCGDGFDANWSEVGKFVTGTDTGDFTFIYMTDSQAFSDENYLAWKRTAENALNKYPMARFAAITGDIVDRGGIEHLWNKFFKYGQKLVSNMPIVPVIGNHETDTGPHTFCDHFLFPKNQNGMPDYVYSFDYSNARFYVLSTEMRNTNIVNNELLNKQMAWLKNSVLSNPKKWNIVLLHKALYSSGYHFEDSEIIGIREKLAPLFDELSIDAVLQGHEHVFAKAFLYKSKTVEGVDKYTDIVKKGNGTFYLINNTAGQKFINVDEYVNYPQLIKCSQPKKSMYTGVTVTDLYIKFDTHVVNGDLKDELYDTFTIVKD